MTHGSSGPSITPPPAPLKPGQCGTDEEAAHPAPGAAGTAPGPRHSCSTVGGPGTRCLRLWDRRPPQRAARGLPLPFSFLQGTETHGHICLQRPGRGLLWGSRNTR